MDQTQSTQQTSTSPQVPASGLQPTGASAQQTGSGVQTSGATQVGSQESLLGKELRVGDSQTIVGVSGQTNAPAAATMQSDSYVWLVLLVPVVILVVIFWPRRDKAETAVATEPFKQPKKVEEPGQQKSTKKVKKTKKRRR